MKYCLLLLTLISGAACAQNENIKKIAQDVSRKRLQNDLYLLASDAMEGRMMATRGDTLASLFIAKTFGEAGLQAPYEKGKSFFQPVVYNRKEFPRASLTIDNKTYNNWDGWYFARPSMESIQLQNIPVVFIGYGIDDARYNDFSGVDVKGKAVILLSGQPRDSSGRYHLSGTNRPDMNLASTAAGLRQKGAALILNVNPRFAATVADQQKTLYRPVFKNHFSAAALPAVPAITISEERANQLLTATGQTIQSLQRSIDRNFKPASATLSATVSIDVELKLIPTTAPNVIGILPGTDPEAGHVIISAHHDHDGKGPEGTFYGAVDNASGTVAIMEVARLMSAAAKSGDRPKRTVVFASYTGEERGLLGAHFLANHPVLPVNKAWAVLNIDMMGRVDTFYSGRRADSMYAYILVKDTLNRGLRKDLMDAHAATSAELKLDTYYEQPQFMQRRLQGSDQYPFYLKGVPFIRIDCGFSKDYHKLTDTPDKINYELLSKQVRLAFLTTWNLANE